MLASQHIPKTDPIDTPVVFAGVFFLEYNSFECEHIAVDRIRKNGGKTNNLPEKSGYRRNN